MKTEPGSLKCQNCRILTLEPWSWGHPSLSWNLVVVVPSRPYLTLLVSLDPTPGPTAGVDPTVLAIAAREGHGMFVPYVVVICCGLVLLHFASSRFNDSTIQAAERQAQQWSFVV